MCDIDHPSFGGWQNILTMRLILRDELTLDQPSPAEVIRLPLRSDGVCRDSGEVARAGGHVFKRRIKREKRYSALSLDFSKPVPIS
jgi:hypothetical protein